MKSRGKVNGAEIREQGMEDEGEAANTGKTKASVRGCIMETLGSGKELTILQKKAWRLLGTVFNFSFFPRDLGFYEKPKESRERILCTLPWTPTSTQIASAYQFSTFKFSLRVSLSVVSQLWDVKYN